MVGININTVSNVEISWRGYIVDCDIFLENPVCVVCSEIPRLVAKLLVSKWEVGSNIDAFTTLAHRIVAFQKYDESNKFSLFICQVALAGRHYAVSEPIRVETHAEIYSYVKENSYQTKV